MTETKQTDDELRVWAAEVMGWKYHACPFEGQWRNPDGGVSLPDPFTDANDLREFMHFVRVEFDMWKMFVWFHERSVEVQMNFEHGSFVAEEPHNSTSDSINQAEARAVILAARAAIGGEA